MQELSNSSLFLNNNASAIGSAQYAYRREARRSRSESRAMVQVINPHSVRMLRIVKWTQPKYRWFIWALVGVVLTLQAPAKVWPLTHIVLTLANTFDSLTQGRVGRLLWSEFL